MRIIRTALIGVGGVGSVHLSCLELLAQKRHLAVVAAADPNGQGLQEQKAVLLSAGVRWYPDYKGMLEVEQNLDAVIIATPIHLHAKMVRHCIQRGLHVLLEKPPVPLLSELRGLLEMKGHAQVAVGFQMICSREMCQIKQLILEGRLGRLQEIRAVACWPRTDKYYRSSFTGRMVVDGHPVFDGPATNALSHLIHNVMFLAGEREETFALPDKVQAEFYRARPVESYDVACLRGSVAQGPAFSVSACHATRELLPVQMEIRGTKGYIRLSNEGMHLNDRIRLDFNGEVILSGYDSSRASFLSLHEDFFDFISGLKERPATRLEDTVGYLLGTNGGLVASGGIHNIPATFVEEYGKGNNHGYDVKGLVDLSHESMATGLLYSELSASWGVTSRPIEGKELNAVSLEKEDLERLSQAVDYRVAGENGDLGKPILPMQRRS